MASAQPATRDLPTNYYLHAYDSSLIEYRNINQYSTYHWRDEVSKKMAFSLPAGTVNTYDTIGVRVEAFGGEWKSTDENVWYAWEGTYEFQTIDYGRNYAILQMKSADVAVQWEVIIGVREGKLVINHRRDEDLYLDPIVPGVPYTVKVASNGRRYKVWINGVDKADKLHQMDPSGDAEYTWRWGIYKSGSNVNEANTLHYVYDIAYGTSDSEGNVLSEVYENNLPGAQDVAKVLLSCNDRLKFTINDMFLGGSTDWTVAKAFYTYFKRGTNVIEIRGEDMGGNAGLLAHIDFDGQAIVSDSSWEVSLDEQAWISATEYETLGNEVWGGNGVENMPLNTTARWIWTADRLYDNTVYFRYVFDLLYNIAPDAVISVSSESDARYAKDNLVDGLFGTAGTGEWASKRESTPWFRLEWSQPEKIRAVVLYDRAHKARNVTSAVLNFSDGSSVSIGALPTDGSPEMISFSPRDVTWLELQVTSSSGPDAGIAEIEVY